MRLPVRGGSIPGANVWVFGGNCASGLHRRMKFDTINTILAAALRGADRKVAHMATAA